jgi:hypothetical protein
MSGTVSRHKYQLWESSPIKNFLGNEGGPKMDMWYGLMITEARGPFLFTEK